MFLKCLAGRRVSLAESDVWGEFKIYCGHHEALMTLMTKACRCLSPRTGIEFNVYLLNTAPYHNFRYCQAFLLVGEV